MAIIKKLKKKLFGEAIRAINVSLYCDRISVLMSPYTHKDTLATSSDISEFIQALYIVACLVLISLVQEQALFVCTKIYPNKFIPIACVTKAIKPKRKSDRNERCIKNRLRTCPYRM